MMKSRKWLSLLLAAVITTVNCIPALASWEDGFVIPGQESGGNDSSYDDIFWGNDYDDQITIGNGSTQDVAFDTDDDSDETTNDTENSGQDDIVFEQPALNTQQFTTSSTGNVVLSENYAEIYGTDSLPKARSDTGSDPYAYLQANDGYVTITADRPLNNILHYNGAIVDNIHIAKWVADDPAALEYPAYCKNPGWKGTAQHQDGQYQIDPLPSIGAEEKKILGVARAGYPYKTPQELGCQSVDEAYYATHAAIHTAIVNGSLDKWSIQSGDTARNTRVLNALKKIYNEGIANPYTPPEFTVKLSPVSGSEEATEDGEWVTNTYQFTSSMDRDYWKFRILGDDLNQMVESGSIEVYAGGTKLSLQTNVSGAWDDQKAFKVPMGQDVTVKVKKDLADSIGINYQFYGTTVGGTFDSSVSYLGNPVGLSGNWQGYIHNFRPQATDTAMMTYNATPTIPDEPDKPSDGSLLVEKLDYNTKETIPDAVFHIRGVSGSCSHINITVKASDGATEPILGDGGKVELSDGVVRMTGIPAGTYEVTEVSAPPHYSVAVGQNSQSVEVVNDAEVHPKVTFENKPYGSLTIRKIDADTQEELAGFYFKVVNHTTGFEQTVVTDSNGEVTIEDLPEGSYEVTEIAARFDYILNDTPQIGEVDWGEETVVVMENHAKPSVEITKIDAETSEPISGVYFEITHKNTQQTYTGVTDEDGKITLEGVDEGWFAIKEVTPADGYIASDEIYEVYAESGHPGEITIKNTKKSGILIRKVDVDGNGIEGVSFNIFRFGEDTPLPNSPVTTGDDGTARLDGLEPGHYQVQEVQAKPGYLLNSKKYDLVVEEGVEKTTIVEVVNHRQPDLTIRKVDKKDPDKGLAGAVFEVKEVDGQALPGSPYTTGPDGSFTIEDIDIENGVSKKLVITEIQPPDGYELSSPNVQYATMEPDQDVTLTFINDESPDLTILKVDKQTGAPLAGAMFTVEKLEEPEKGFITGSPFTTDAEGKIVLPNMAPGSYRIVETKAPQNYVIDTAERIINLVEGEDFTAKFEDTKKPTLTVHKVDSITKDPLKNAQFEVYRAVNGSLDGETVMVGSFTSDASGIFKLENAEPGWYRIVEKQAPSGYERKTESIDVFLKAGEDKEITFENALLSAIIIKKIDAETGEALEGIKFEVRYLSGATGTEGTVIGTYTTSKNGTITIAGLKKGVYSIAEVSSDSDHILDETIQTVTLADDNSVVTVEFTNAPLGGLLIKKMDAVTKEPLSDVTFKVTDIKGAVVGESNGEYRTDETGTIYIPQLVGGFIVQEIKTKDGYILDNTAKTIYIEKGRVYSMEFFNQPENSFVIQKLDGETKAPLADATIKVTTVDDQFIGQYTTDESGIITIAGLKPGTYKVQELKAPEGYNLDNTVKLVHLKQNEPQKLELYNYKKAALIIYKVDKNTQEPLEGAKFKVTEIDGTYVGDYITGTDGRITVPTLEPGWYVVTETAAPNGYNIDDVPSKNVQVKSGSPVTVKFENDKNATLRIEKTDIVTGEPMENVEFSIVRDDGKTYGKYYTDKRGEINLEYMFPAGTYLIRETNTRKGYALDTNVRKVTLEWGDDKLIEWENYPLASIRIEKIDKENDEPMANVTFELFDPNKKSLGTYKTDAKGRIELNDMFLGGTTYYLKEETPEGYLPQEGYLAVETRWGKTTYVDIENEPIMGKVQIHKTAADNNPITGTLKGDGLKGAKFTIYDADGKKVDVLTTDSKGYAESDWLRYGEYTMKETTSPLYFLLSDETIHFEIVNDGETVEIERTNQSTLLKTNVEKSGYKETMGGSVIRYDIYNIQNQSMVPLENFYLHESLPADAAYITRLFTGTFNQNLNYTIYYKTNKTGTFRVLKDNLFTDRVYEIDCTKGLMAGEYITDIKFDFGTVDVGFREVERPFLYCKTYDNLPNGYQFTNRAEVGGTYEMQKVTAEDTFTTKIYAPTVDRGKLPKTGY